jgi:quercetin dioxygenase-like cupin family protein
VSDPKEIVRRGYDAIADRYDEWAASFETPELHGVGELLDRLPATAAGGGLRARPRPRRSARGAGARARVVHVGSGKIARLKTLDFDPGRALPISGFGSLAATAVPLTLPDGEAHVVCIRLGAGGILGRHPAPVDQLFVVIEGEGWASGPDGERVPVAAGTAIHWAAGEEHEAGSDAGLTAIVVESERLVPHIRNG